jgi:hypothetical protein
LQCHLYKLAVEKNVFVLIGLISQWNVHRLKC